MKKRELIEIVDDNYILKENHVDSVGDTVWEIIDPQTGNTFLVHSFTSGKLYIHFFKRCKISDRCALDSLRKICEILMQKNLNPTITISDSNTSLICLCKKIGFKKSTIRHTYYLKNLK